MLLSNNDYLDNSNISILKSTVIAEIALNEMKD